MMRPNPVFFALVAGAGAAAFVLAVLAAEAHGKRRQRKAWLMEAGAA